MFCHSQMWSEILVESHTTPNVCRKMQMKTLLVRKVNLLQLPSLLCYFATQPLAAHYICLAICYPETHEVDLWQVYLCLNASLKTILTPSACLGKYWISKGHLYHTGVHNIMLPRQPLHKLNTLPKLALSVTVQVTDPVTSVGNGL